MKERNPTHPTTHVLLSVGVWAEEGEEVNGKRKRKKG